MTTKEIQITRVENMEEVGELIEGKIVEVEGRKSPMKCRGNFEKNLDFIGRRNDACISRVEINLENISARKGKAVFNQPYRISSYFPKDSQYSFLDKELLKGNL